MGSDSETQQIRQGRAKFVAMAGSYFLGTFNDNFYKQAVMLLAVAAGHKAFQNVAAAAFVIPFVLFAAPAGWAADRFPKRNAVLGAKATELFAAFIGAVGLITGHLWLMVGMVGLMGLQSTFFSPALNGSIPELYPASYVTQANAVLRMLVTVAILVGTALAGIVLDIQGLPLLGTSRGKALLALIVIAIGIIGLVVSLGVPRRNAADPGRAFPWTGPLDTFRELRRAYQDRLLGRIISTDVFIWSVGAVQLLLINPLGLEQYHLSNQRTSFLVAAQMVGIGLGGLLAARLAKGERWHRVLVPAGFLMSAFMALMVVVPFLPRPFQVPTLYALLAMVGTTGGLIMIPCESFVQVRPAPERKGAVWASANFAVFGGIAIASIVSIPLVKAFRPTTAFGILACIALAYTLWLSAGFRRTGASMIASLLCVLGRGLLSLRYRVRIMGLDVVRQKGRAGILFLPNHPALVDPVILMAHLQPYFAPGSLADRDQIGSPIMGWIARKLGAKPLPDVAKYGEACKAEVERVITECTEDLRKGGNLLLYPSGRLMRSRNEDLGGNSAVEVILERVPNARVVLLRTRGLWGSSFSRASGKQPHFGDAFIKGFWRWLANGIFFMPRRKVFIECFEPETLPRTEGRQALNRTLEAYYNQDTSPALHVPYGWWEAEGIRELPDPPLGHLEGNAQDVPAAIRATVEAQLKELTGVSVLKDEHQLARDLGLDSLKRMELQIWLEQEFAAPPCDPEALRTVADALLSASGVGLSSGLTELKPVPPSWFSVPEDWVPNVPKGSTITEVFLRQASQDPTRPVLADQMGGVKSYRDVITAVLALKPLLSSFKGEYLGIMLPASSGAAVLYLAALFAGKTPVMVNWTVGERNLSHTLELLGVKHVLTAGQLLTKLQSQGLKLEGIRDRFILLEEAGRNISKITKIFAWLQARYCWASLRSVQSHDTAVVLFTSGSESLPKAVPLSHANILANVRDIEKIFHPRPTERIIGFLPPFHSFGLTGTVILPLLSGIRVVYHANPTEGATLARLIEAYRVSLLVGTPTFLANVVRAAEDEQLCSLRLAISGAEKCPETLFETLERRWPGMKVLEGYGITECSPVVSVNYEDAPRRGTIGKPLESVQIAVRKVEGEGRAKPGETGMLLVRGPSIFGGYLHYEGPSPFEEFESKLWYRTGDLVREESDGSLVFAGRLKRFVKLGGEMVSLPAVEEALVKRYGREEDTEPMLAVEATPSETNPELVLFTVRDIPREACNTVIREAGLSSIHSLRHIKRIEKIPTLGTGKTDYRALKAMLVG